MRNDPTRALKILWKPEEQAEDRLKASTLLPGLETADSERGSTEAGLFTARTREEILLPATVLQEIHIALIQSTEYLPKCAQQFQGWQVGLLERFCGV